MTVNGLKIESGANLSEANLTGTNLSWAKLIEANLSEAYLSEAYLREANLSWGKLSEANLTGTNLSWAKLIEANLSEAKNIPELPETIIVPEGDLIVYKKVSTGVAKLLIPKEAKRVNGTSRKCRAEYAIVLDCPEGAVSLHNRNFKYIKGQKVVPDSFDENRWNECSNGIHFFLTYAEAEQY